MEPKPLGTAFNEAIYTSPAAVRAALQAHAKGNGYAISTTSSTSTRVVFSCSKGGKYDNRNKCHVHESRHRKGTSTTKTDCKFRVIAKPIVNMEPIQWKVTVLDNRHNHEAVISLSALPHHRIGGLSEESVESLRK